MSRLLWVLLLWVLLLRILLLLLGILLLRVLLLRITALLRRRLIFALATDGDARKRCDGKHTHGSNAQERSHHETLSLFPLS
ncbi:MAG TPA: hypothetical protein VFQ35_07220, partial [Polyangiaceae bacterium]|nr:hypothetical protein [Polyangiaceae bacterium]